MQLSLEELKKSDERHFDLDLDLSDIEINDALIKKIGHVVGQLDVDMVGDDAFVFNFDTDYNVSYLDARTLEPLDLNWQMVDDIMLTSNKNTAEELDIDWVSDDVVDVDQLIAELIIVNIPYNYSQAPSMNVEVVEEENTYHPFKNISTEEE